ncbi:MAG TPA: hypothetical protein VH370_27220, partial [Humisphaera sp.]|nr:hypothetical protein [Humisphaera sp.]
MGGTDEAVGGGLVEWKSGNTKAAGSAQYRPERASIRPGLFGSGIFAGVRDVGKARLWFVADVLAHAAA